MAKFIVNDGYDDERQIEAYRYYTADGFVTFVERGGGNEGETQVASIAASLVHNVIRQDG